MSDGFMHQRGDPMYIFKSCLIEFNMEIFRSCALLLLAAVIMQAVCLTLNKFIFNRYVPRRRKVLQYCTIVPIEWISRKSDRRGDL